MSLCALLFFFFFFNDTATTEIYTLSLHDALPICKELCGLAVFQVPETAHLDDEDHPLIGVPLTITKGDKPRTIRSEEHTSELQSRLHLVCRLLLEKKKHIN